MLILVIRMYISFQQGILFFLYLDLFFEVFFLEILGVLKMLTLRIFSFRIMLQGALGQLGALV